MADPESLKRVLINLLDNAVKYGPEGQSVLVEVGAGPDHGSVSVIDEGPGVPADEFETIWKPFARLGRDEGGPQAGSGIGLSIVKRLMEAMGGEVSVTAALGGGAEFVIRLPAAAPGRDSPAADSHAAAGAGPASATMSR